MVIGADAAHLRRVLAAGFAPPLERRTLGICAALVLIMVETAAVGIIRIAMHRSSQPGAAAHPRALSANDAAATTWVVRDLPRDAVIVADFEVGTELSRSFSHVLVVSAQGQDLPAGIASYTAYVVSTAQLRADARSKHVLAGLVASSVPVAVFGRGRAAAIVRQASAARPAQVIARRREEREARQAAEYELLSNRALRASVQAQRFLRTGDLDMRVATVLVLMADKGAITVAHVLPFRAEMLAGLPARVVDVRATKAASLGVLAGLPAQYRLASNRLLSDGTHRLTWPVSLETASGG
jgi:hypothetical protein